MRTLSVQYPGSIPAIMNVAPEFFEEEAKMAMAVKLFEMGKLTSGQAAVMAGMPRVAFLLQCCRFGVACAEWSDEELEQEFRTAF
jgi:predicted HTH domain antitoxin